MRALLSVANRQGLAGLARDLLALGVEVYATDGTREHLAADGIAVLPVTALTTVPPLLGGMVKTFHPAVYAGILARRDRPEQLGRAGRARRSGSSTSSSSTSSRSHPRSASAACPSTRRSR